MDIHDIQGIIVTDNQSKLLYQKRYIECDITESITSAVFASNDPILIHNDKLVLHKKLDELCIILYAACDVNEILLNEVLSEFITAFCTVVKALTVDSLWKKYDQVILLVDAFVYEGIILETQAKAMIDKIPKRSFEGVEGMKVPKGFASLLNKATKSFRSG